MNILCCAIIKTLIWLVFAVWTLMWSFVCCADAVFYSWMIWYAYCNFLCISESLCGVIHSNERFLYYVSWKTVFNSLAANDVYRRQLKYNRSLPMTSIDVNYVFHWGWHGNDLADLGNEDQTCKQRFSSEMTTRWP